MMTSLWPPKLHNNRQMLSLPNTILLVLSRHLPTAPSKNLFHLWNRSNIHLVKKTNHQHTQQSVSSTTKEYCTSRQLPTKTPVKDDPPVTPMLKTLSTIDTSDPNNKLVANDILINFTIWNQSIVHYCIPNQHNAYYTTPRNRSRLKSSTAIHHVLIGVYDNKLLSSPTLPCLFFILLDCIVCLVLSYVVLLADSFTLVKINDWFPGEWYE